jgi:hypothetical protein
MRKELQPILLKWSNKNLWKDRDLNRLASGQTTYR